MQTKMSKSPNALRRVSHIVILSPPIKNGGLTIGLGKFGSEGGALD
jgi:hypothetical protein